jgi:hypothetical protein
MVAAQKQREIAMVIQNCPCDGRSCANEDFIEDLQIKLDTTHRWAAAWKSYARRYHDAAQKCVCVYCGHESSDFDSVRYHIMNCEKRPEKVLIDKKHEIEAELASLRAVNAKLVEAVEYSMNQIDYLRNLWGDEGVTRNVADRLREALAAANADAPV